MNLSYKQARNRKAQQLWLGIIDPTWSEFMVSYEAESAR
jgi:hypothetical protein